MLAFPRGGKRFQDSGVKARAGLGGGGFQVRRELSRSERRFQSREPLWNWDRKDVAEKQGRGNREYWLERATKAHGS